MRVNIARHAATGWEEIASAKLEEEVSVISNAKLQAHT
jgi:hypothetical protein